MKLKTTILISHSEDLYETPNKDGRLYRKAEVQALLDSSVDTNAKAMRGTIVWPDEEAGTFASLSTACHRVSRLTANQEGVTIEGEVYEDRSGGWVLLNHIKKSLGYELAVIWDETPGEDGVMVLSQIDSFPAVPVSYLGPLIPSETPSFIKNPYCIPLSKVTE